MAPQKQLTILIAVAASLVSFLGGYLLTRPSVKVSAVLQEQRGSLIDRFDGVVQTATPTPLPPGLLQASDQTVISPTNTLDEESILYYSTNGVFKLNLETRKSTIISDTLFSGLVRVIWSPDRNRVITVSQKTQGQVYSYFDYTTHEHGVLGSNIADAVFSPDSSQIAIARSPGSGEGTIEVAGFNGKNPKTILRTRLQGIKLYWPQQNLISFSAGDADQDTQSLYSLGIDGGLDQIVGGADHLSVRWAPSGVRVLYSTDSRLYLYDLQTKESYSFLSSATAENCDWKNDSLYFVCAEQTGGETSVISLSVQNQSSKILFSHLIITPDSVFFSRQENFLVIVSAANHTPWAVKLTSN